MTAKRRSITLTDIAAQLRVSKVTVSKALRDHPDIGAAMKEKVKEKAKELNYRPNRLAQNLTSRRTRTIGLVVPRVEHHFFASAIESIYNTAHELNYDIIMMLSQEDSELEKRHIHTLLSMKVDGLLVSLAESTEETEIFYDIRRQNIPLMFFDRVINDSKFCRVRSDNEGAAYSLVRYAIEQGYHSIGHLGGPENSSIGGARYRGFVKALEEADIPIRQKFILRNGFGYKDGASAFWQLYHTNSLPDILFAVTYPVALGLYNAAREHGIIIPDELDIISFGDSPYNRFMNPSITCAHQPAEEIGKFAVEELLHHIEDSDIKAIDKVFPVNIIKNQTCIKRG